MKRIACVLLCILLVFPATAESLFQTGEPHASTLEFRQYFETMSAVRGNHTLSIAARIYNEALAQKLYETVDADLNAIAKKLSISPEQFAPHTVFVVERLVNGSMERQENRVYCKAEQIENGAYRPLLICAVLDTEEYWLGVGLAGYIFGDVVEHEHLRQYYASVEELNLLSLSIPYFLPDFATEEELTIACDTAISLCQYAVEHHGYEALLADDGVALRREWLAWMGVEREYDDLYYQVLQRYRFRAASQYTAVAVNDYGHSVYLKPMEDMSTAHDLRMFLYDMMKGPETLFALVDMQAPDYATLIRSRYEGEMRIYCGHENGSYAVPEYREIRLALAAGYMHELGHMLVPAVNGANAYTTMWQYEGLCHYMNYKVYPFYAVKWQCHQALHLFKNMEVPQSPNHPFMMRAVEMYLRNAPLPESVEQTAPMLYIQTMALVPLLYPDDAAGAAWSKSIQSFYPGLRSENGNELTEMQACALTDYLVDRYGLATFLTFCQGEESIEDVFGITYAEANEAWRQRLMSELE